MITAIEAEALSKQYRIVGDAPPETLYDTVSGWIGSPLQQLQKFRSREEKTFWALKDVDFVIQEGDSVGVIGRNGAGKSTLLKILSRITAPTRGRVTLRGRVASLLEVGTGFHPELSGRENVFLNGAILGMTRREVTRKFDEIVAFAEIEQFVDTPVKRYSSGMYVRLAFAVAAHLEADILVVDEVLAVGDAAFQRKSLSKMGDVARRGRTVLFVSHNLGAIRNFCTRALVLERGMMAFDGDVSAAIAMYERSFAGAGAAIEPGSFAGPLRKQLTFSGLVFRQLGEVVEVVDPLIEVEIEVRGSALRRFDFLNVKVAFFRDGLLLGSCYDAAPDTAMEEGAFLARMRIAADVFRAGRYTLGIGAEAGTGTWMWAGDVASLDVSESRRERRAERMEGVIGIPHRGERVQPGGVR